MTTDVPSRPRVGTVRVVQLNAGSLLGDPFLRRGNAGRVLSAALAFHEPITGILASDHCGLVVDIVWPDRPTP